MEEFLQIDAQLIKKIDSIILENIALKKENATLRQENAVLREEIEKLKDRLGLNSTNSSIPTSKELYKIKKENRQKSSRNPGGQPGHKGHKRDEMVSDETIRIPLNSMTCECGGEIRLGQNHVHQKIEIPEIKPHITEYHMERGRCRSCGRRKSSNLPQGVTNDLFGPRVKAIASSLTGFYKNSKREVEAILKDVFNLKISLGTISNNEHRVSEKAKDNYETTELELSYSQVLHADETSHYTKGKMGWCWLFSNLHATIIKLASSRGMKVLKESVFGPNDYGVVITDRYGAYNYFNEDSRQVCWAHLARDFERFANSSNLEVKSIGEYLRLSAQELFTLKRSLLSHEIDLLRFLRTSGKLRKQIWYYLNQIVHLQNVDHAARIAKNMIKSENMMWKFLDDPVNIPLTNNHAEQQIRHYVTYRKNSYFTWSERGNRFLERIISLYLTCKQQKKNPYLFLNNILTTD